MITWLNSLKTFERTLALLAVMSRHPVFGRLTQPLTRALAWLNVRVNGHRSKESLAALGETWKAMMPPNDQELFRITEVTEEAAYAEIHLNCPLRGTETAMPATLMNYDRSLMKAVGGRLEVLESQATSGMTFCRLAIRLADGSQPKVNHEQTKTCAHCSGEQSAVPRPVQT